MFSVCKFAGYYNHNLTIKRLSYPQTTLTYLLKNVIYFTFVNLVPQMGSSLSKDLRENTKNSQKVTIRPATDQGKSSIDKMNGT